MTCDLCLHTGDNVKPYIYGDRGKTLTTYLCTSHASYWGYL